MSETECVFSKLSDDLALNIFLKLQDEPREWPRLACVSTRFSSLVHICCQIKYYETIPDFISAAHHDGFASLYQIAVRCPGLVHSGVIPETVYYGSNYCWPLLAGAGSGQGAVARCLSSTRKMNGPLGPHLVSVPWGLSCKQGQYLLSTRYRGDCLYLCNWPGCVHSGERRNYMLFRGVFRDFKQSEVWRTLNERRNKHRVSLSCAFCASRQSWNLHSACCLGKYFGNHGDGEPVIRAYVCENGHVSGAWSGSPTHLY